MRNPENLLRRGRSWRALAAMTAAVTAVTLGGTAAASASVHPAVSHHRLGCHAYVTNTHPQHDSQVGVIVVAKTHAHARAVAHFMTLKATEHGRVKHDGRRTLWFSVGRAPYNFRVRVHVKVTMDGQTAWCRSWFTPNHT